ncbi:MAG: hypothetical protein FIB01_16455 [Gemmatimonadetes bacterium]|nr:hypothetical protein [Gemmatimonadota bacterium]
MRLTKSLAAVMAVGVVVGCSDSMLAVDNPNSPDRGRVLGSASDVEALASSQFQQVINATWNSIYAVDIGMMTASFMNSSGLANNGLGPRSGIPRQPIDNNRGNAYQTDNYRDFRYNTAVARNSADILARAKDAGFKLPGGEGDLNRLKAFSHFTYGVSLGYLALTYDSAGIPRPTDTGNVPPLEGYPAIMTYGLAQFDSAIAYASKSGTSALPTAWLNGIGGPSVNMTDFIKITHSFAARLRAGVARTPTERAAVNWAKVIEDANAGITANLDIFFSPSNGWDHAWMDATLHFRDSNWHQMNYYGIGFADTSGAFDAWLATARDSRAPFLIKTPDARFPRGDTREAQNADRGGQGAPTGGRYYRNRLAGLDQAALGWQNSYYDHYRFYAWSQASRVGAKPYFTKAENDMLAAEGYIRTGNIAAAAALIDRTRASNGLAALTGVVTSASQQIPGGTGCVPRVPVGPNYTTTACGTILDAMKWEKRMETGYTTYGAWFFDSRGWGDLPEGTPVMWPIPNQEQDARLLPIYNLGGVGQVGGAGKSTYGFGDGNK